MAERIAWGDADRIDRQAVRYLEGRHVGPLRRLIFSVPLLDGVRLAKQLARQGPPPQAGDPLLARLAAVDEHLVARVTATAARDSCSVHERITGSAEWLSFGFGDPVLTLTSYEPPGITRISMLRDGAWSDVYRGELQHHAVACIDAENVVVIRDDPEHGCALVHYASGDERPVILNRLVNGMQPAATAAGFVAGSVLQPSVVVAGPELPPGFIDLARFGLINACRLAVNQTGEAIAFGGEGEVVVTDARVEDVVARSVVPLPHGPVRGLAFTTPREVIAGGRHGGLSRWRISVNEALVLEAAGDAPSLSGLFAIPAWGVIGGRDDGEGEHRFFDPVTLEPVSPPRPFIEARYDPRLVHTIKASADGRFAAVGGYLNLNGPHQSTDMFLVVHDFHHPLARVLRPVVSLRESDLDAISRATDDANRHTDEERHVLELLRAVTEHQLSGQWPA
jgi:hypothetical protein